MLDVSGLADRLDRLASKTLYIAKIRAMLQPEPSARVLKSASKDTSVLSASLNFVGAHADVHDSSWKTFSHSESVGMRLGCSARVTSMTA